MSEPVHAIVIAHGTLAAGLVDAVRQITGEDADSLTAVSNRALSPDALTAAVEAHLTDAPTLLFTDLPSGSCGFAARKLAPGRPNLGVVSGVNLPMLLEFVMHRTEPLDVLVPRLLAKGRTAVSCAPPHLENHGHRAVSGR